MIEVRRPPGFGIAAATGLAMCWLADDPASAADLAATVAARPTEPSAFGSFLAGRHAQDVKDFGSAADLFAEVLATQPEDVALLQDTFIAMANEGRFVEAADIGRRLQRLSAKSETIDLILALQNLKSGDIGAATADVEKLSTDGLGRFTVPLVRAWVYFEAGKFDAALAAIQPLADVAGIETLYSLHLGLINELGGHPAEAAKAYEETIKDSEKLSFRLVEIVGSFYLRQGQTNKAQALYERFREAYPDNPLIGLIIADGKAGRKATPVAITPRDGLAEALFNLASVLFQEQAGEMAMVFIRLAIELRPDFPAAQVLLGDLLASDRRYADSVGVYRSVDSRSPFGWQARLSLADSLNRLDRTPEAISLLETMTKERPDAADAPMLLGDILRNKERFAEAANAYDHAIARVGTLQPRHWSLLYYRGIVFERSKQWAKAEADFTRALEFEPDQPYVLNYLAYSWIELGENYDRALEMLNKAVEQRPEDGFIVDSLGWVYYRLGKYEQAVEQLEKAVELQPGDPVINDHLGDALWRVGRQNEARFQWKRALNLSPAEDQVAPIESKLERGLPKDPSGTGRAAPTAGCRAAAFASAPRQRSISICTSSAGATTAITCSTAWSPLLRSATS